MTKNPLALASALEKIAVDSRIEAVRQKDVAQLFIDNPQEKATAFASFLPRTRLLKKELPCSGSFNSFQNLELFIFHALFDLSSTKRTMDLPFTSMCPEDENFNWVSSGSKKSAAVSSILNHALPQFFSGSVNTTGDSSELIINKKESSTMRSPFSVNESSPSPERYILSDLAILDVQCSSPIG